MASNISNDLEVCRGNIEKVINAHIIEQMEEFGDEMIDSILPSQAEFRNLTGNTLTSYAYGVYLNGEIQTIGMYSGKDAIRVKLNKGEILRGFTDYDGGLRTYFKADVDTDRGYGNASSRNFLTGYKPKGKYSLIFTTGTEYSAYLENVLNMNVLTDGFMETQSDFLNSFKQI